MNLSPSPFLRFSDNNGAPLVGGLLFTYQSGTDVKQATYTDSAGGTLNSNPIVLDYRGEASVWLDPTKTYKYVLSPKTDTDPPTNPIKTVDNISGATGTATVFGTTIADIFTGTGSQATFAISQNPGNVANLDVSVDGATLVPTLDYQWTSGTNVTFTVAPRLGQTILIRYIQGLPTGISQAAPYYIQTEAEITAGVVPVNYAYLPMHVDRYATNSTPGTTSMVAAFNAAFKVAVQSGGTIRYGETSLYLLDAPVNFAVVGAPNNPGVLVQGPGCAVDFPVFSIIAKHNGMSIFDCTGNDAIRFKDVAVTTDATTFPQTGILTARNNSGGSLIFKAENVYIIGWFGTAPYYNYGSEDDSLINCFFENRNPASNTATRVYTGTNISGITSPFVTIATGTLSNIDHNDFGCLDNNIAGTATSDCIRLEGASSLKKYGGWWSNASPSASGRALVYVDMSVAASSLIKLHGVTGENSSHNSQYGILFSNHVQTPTGWNIDACNMPNVTAAIATAGSNPVIDNFALRDLVTPTGGGIAISGTLQNSASFDFGSITTAIGTSARNRLSGDVSRLTVTTRTDDYWIDTGSTAKTWTPDTSALTVTGALTVSNKRVLFHGSQVTVTVTLAAATSIVCAAGTNLGGLPAAASVRSANVSVVNSDTPALIGMGAVVGSNIKLPAINVTTPDVTITATYFVA